ncbi:SDR family oxidoreductase [Georgenia halophila]|uniref:SDR family oxidoreductase n=1 Tax=Georgenia halophila TaxID=620889 RepID=A0ABP8KTF5_9MICO
MAAVDYRGQTTLVTGASAGIGIELADVLAERGSDLVLVARRRERLEEIERQITARHGTAVHVVPLDLAEPAPGARIVEAIGGDKITSVVNNAGFGTFGPFHEEDPERLREEIAVDVSAVVDISRTFIGQLRKSGQGVLVNVASMVAYQPAPNMAVYGAAKTFVLNFTEALWHESQGTGLKVMAVSPGATQTEFFDVVGNPAASGGARLRSPREVAETTLSALDRRTPPPSIAVGRGNRLAAALAPRLLSSRQRGRLIRRLTTRAA